MGRTQRAALGGIDVAATLTVAATAVTAGLGRAVYRRKGTHGRGSEGSDAPLRLLTFEGDYTLSTIRDRQLEHLVTCRDLDGFFDHVWSVHAAAGASPDEPPESSVGPPTTTPIAPGHTMVEGRVAYSSWLQRLPILNFSLGQCALLTRLDRLIRGEDITVVRASDPFYLGLLGLVLARANRIPLVVRLIANYDSDFYAAGRAAYPRLFRRRWIEKRIGRLVLRQADLIAAGNQDLLRYALANGAPEERCTVFLVGNAIDPLHFDFEPSERPSVRDELGVGNRPFVVLVSRLEPDKHPEDVLVAFAEARRNAPELAAVLVGDGSMRSQLEAMTEELGVEAAVVFAGNRSQDWIANALTSATVVLSPLTGRALVEAALSGTPIVAYDVDWQSELVRTGETGILVANRDTAGMAGAVCRLLADPQYANSLAAAARRSTLEAMNPEALIKHERLEYGRLFSLS